MTIALPTLEEGETWIVRFGRLGYIVEGLVYIIVGILATEAALGTGGRTTDIKGAFQTIGTAPFGMPALAIVAVGLFGYAAWRIVSSITDAERIGNKPTTLAFRVADFIEGLAYGSFGVWVTQYLIHDQVSVGDDTPAMTHRMMEIPGGRWIVMIVGLSIFAYALYQFHSALRRKFLHRLDLSAARRARLWIERLGGFGVAARASVFAMVGMLILRAGWEIDASRAGGIEKSLDVIANQPAGGVMFAFVAIGLIAYGVLQIVTARYRSMRAM
jgi:hypothetical protein